MIAALYKTEGAYTLYTENSLIQVSSFIEKYIPLEIVEVPNIKFILKENPSPEFVVISTDSKYIWLYALENVPDGWTLDQVMDTVNKGKILPFKLIEGRFPKYVDLTMDEEISARKEYAEWFREYRKGISLPDSPQ